CVDDALPEVEREVWSRRLASSPANPMHHDKPQKKTPSTIPPIPKCFSRSGGWIAAISGNAGGHLGDPLRAIQGCRR
ncbi:MAG: hypothetical protein AAGC57_21885, partial [Pseudomonadota bacterium]